jgi:hypothetical protein
MSSGQRNPTSAADYGRQVSSPHCINLVDPHCIEAVTILYTGLHAS